MSRKNAFYRCLITLAFLPILLALLTGCNNIFSSFTSSLSATPPSIQAPLPIAQPLHALANMFNLAHKPLDTEHNFKESISSNYAGYIVQQTGGKNFSTVSSSWTVPKLTCSPKGTSQVAFWTGLTGKQHKTIAQIAIVGLCQNGKADYGADWELFPASARLIERPVQAGDSISARVSYQDGQFTLTMNNTQQGWSFSTNQPGDASNSTIAECITEAPTLIQNGSQHNITDLANFGSVNISCQPDGTPIGSYEQVSQYQMIAKNATASTSGLDDSGSSFKVTWQGK